MPEGPMPEGPMPETVLAAPCPQCQELVYYPGWWCEGCQACACPDLLREADDEPDDDYG